MNVIQSVLSVNVLPQTGLTEPLAPLVPWPTLRSYYANIRTNFVCLLYSELLQIRVTCTSTAMGDATGNTPHQLDFITWVTALCRRVPESAPVVRSDYNQTCDREKGEWRPAHPTCCPRWFWGCWWTPGSRGTWTWRWRRCASRTPPWCWASAAPPAGWRRRTGRTSTSHPEEKERERDLVGFLPCILH